MVKNPPANAGDRYGFHLWVRKIHWRRGGHRLQYPCLENPLERGAGLATVHGVAELGMTEVT